MVGAIILVAVLLVVFPVVVMMSMSLVAALLGSTIKNVVDADNAGSELLALSQADPHRQAQRA